MPSVVWTRVKVLAVVLLLIGTTAFAVGAYVLTRSSGPAAPRQLTSPERDCGELQSFSSQADLESHLQQAPPSVPYAQGGGIATLGADSGGARGGTTYSGTNNQAAGVDEADIVKTDGTNIYSVTWNYTTGNSSVAVVRAYPPASAALLAEIPVQGWVQGLFVSGTRLAVLAGGWQTIPMMDPGPGRYPYWRGDVEVLVYDVSDPAAPAFVRNVSVTGNYIGARMIGDVVYVVAEDYLYLYQTEVVMPEVWADGVPRALTYADLRYFNDSEGSNVDTTVLAVNISGSEAPTVESFLTRGGYQLYMSAENLYIAGVQWDWTPDQRVGAESTTIHKVSIAGTDVHYLCSVRVPGTVLNQFSMDESGGYLRVATTLGQWTSEGRDTSAAVFVFDGSMVPTGSVSGIAPGERIYAARFLGDRAYLVTYRQVDPLFVLDVSDPTAPRVLGFLEVSGVSDYLHPYDATHLIGVGMASVGPNRLQGIKLSLFDVADVAHPTEVANYTIGGSVNDSYAYSEALYDHKAFLFIPSPRDLVVLPITMWRYDTPDGTSWDGAYALTVTPQAGFTLKASITHEDFGVPGPVRGDDSVRRSLYLGDVLYTVSNGLVLGNNLDTFAEVARVPL